MNVITTVTALFILTLTGCNNHIPGNEEKKDIPKVLEDKSTSLDISSRRGDGDLVETLYSELVEKTPELKHLEDKIEELSKGEADSSKAFDNYNLKNQTYYNSANIHMEQIKDSLLRDKVRSLIAKSLSSYHSFTSRHKDLLNSIEAKSVTLRDLHTILKITRTLPEIEKFQKDNLPSAGSLEGFLKQLNGTVKYADSISNK